MIDSLAQLANRTAEVDQLVVGSFPARAGVALAAVGGYGRRELFPYSDIDLLFLAVDDAARDKLREPLSIYLRSPGTPACASVNRYARRKSAGSSAGQPGISNCISACSIGVFSAGDEAVFARLAALLRRAAT